MARFFITPLLLAGLTAGCSDSGVSKVAEVEVENTRQRFDHELIDLFERDLQEAGA